MNDMPDEVFAGLFICSHNPDVIEEARVWNVRIDQPVPEGYNPDKEGYIGCRLETMNVFDGTRKVIHESKGRFEAPNWMPDGKKLLFNENGSLFTIPVDGGTPEKLNTGEASRLNNDHGISFDGKMLAISHSPAGKRFQGICSASFRRHTQTDYRKSTFIPSWMVSRQQGSIVCCTTGYAIYNIYKNSVNGGKEVQLTFNKSGHVDGPEGSPDGKYIYYNGSQSGTMQIWRMKPDGSGKEQLTFDEYNDWFPHISPDGKWIVFISFPTEIDPDVHPSYKRVMLTADACQWRCTQGNRLSIRRTGNHQCSFLVARQQADCFCE